MRIAVIGMGSIGRRHLRNVRGLMPNAELVGVDSAAPAREWAESQGGLEIFEDLAAALDTRPDAALVCSPTGLHAEQLRACVERDIPAYVEKPIAARLTADLVATLEEADRRGCPIVVAANLRYMPGAALLAQRAADGQLGRLVGVYAHAGAYLPEWKPNRELRDYRQSYSASANEGGAMCDYAHEFDLLRWWGGGVRAVSASVRRASDLAIESEDVADVLLEFESGAAGTLHVDYLERCPRRFIQLLFSEGGVVWDITAQRVEEVDAAGKVTTAVDLPRYDLDECYREGFADFLRVLASPSEARCVQSGWEGAEALAIIDAAREAGARRSRVEVGEIRARAGLVNSKLRIQNSTSGLHGATAERTANLKSELSNLGSEISNLRFEISDVAGGASSSPPSLPTLLRDHPQSAALLARARRVIPCATQTMSKGPSQFVQGPSPIYLHRGRGCRVWDVDGHEYIDWIMALGPIVLGYADADVDAAVMRQMGEGPTFSLMHPLEVEVAELLCEVIPSAQAVRFLKTGSEACSAAIRIARAFTGRELVASSGYHGWHDWSAATLPLRRGVPESICSQTLTFEYDDLDSLRQCFADHPGEIAAVILEPMCLHWPKDGFLRGVVDTAHEHGALAIFDEVITGFRWALGGAQEYFGVMPDLSAFGKALANGLPLSAVAGRRGPMTVLEDGTFVSLTHGGETLSLAAAKATIEKLRRTGGIQALWERGRRLWDALQALLVRHELLEWYRLEGPACRFAVTPRSARGVEAPLARSILQQELVLRGVLFGGTHVFSFAHDEAAIAETIAAYEEALPAVRRALESGRVEDFLLGPPIKPVFEPRPSAECPPRRVNSVRSAE